MKAVLGIGTNIGNRLENIENVYSSLSLLPNTKIIKRSSVYETEPWGYEQQDRFLNCAVLIETELSPNALLGACMSLLLWGSVVWISVKLLVWISGLAPVASLSFMQSFTLDQTYITKYIYHFNPLAFILSL